MSLILPMLAVALAAGQTGAAPAPKPRVALQTSMGKIVLELEPGVRAERVGRVVVVEGRDVRRALAKDGIAVPEPAPDQPDATESPPTE